MTLAALKKDLSWLPLTLTPSEIVDVASTGTLDNVETRTTDSLAAILRFTGAAPTVTGLVAGRRKITLMAVGGPLILANENAGSVAANRIVTGTGADLTVAEGSGVELAYDNKSTRWRVTGGGSPGGGDVTTTNGDAPQAAAEVDTTDATVTNIGEAVTLAIDSVTTVDVAVQCIQAGASKCKIFNIRRSFLNDGGAVTDGTQTDLITPEELGGSLAATVAISRTSTTVQPKVTGIAGVGLRWYLIRQEMKVGALTGSVPAAPTAISPTSGSGSGGTSVQITVPSSTGLTGAKVGGVALTSFAIDDATHVSGVTGAHASGAVDVVVSNVFGDSAALVGAYTYGFNPATLSLTGWWRASYAASPWVGVASAGTSGTRNLTEATNPPAAGAPINGLTPADFDGTNDELDGDTGTNLMTAAAYSGAALVWIDAIATNNDPSSAPFANEAILSSVGTGEFGVGLRDNAGTRSVNVWHYNGGGYNHVSETIALGAWALVQWKLTGGNIRIRVNSGVWQSNAATNVNLLTPNTRIGANYNAGEFFDGKLAELMLSNTALTDTEFDDFKSYINTRYGLAL